MKAVLEISQVQIEEAIRKYFASLDATAVKLESTPLIDERSGMNLGAVITAKVTVEIGEPVAQ